MAEVTIGQARDNLSAIIAELVNGTVDEYIIKNRSTPVVRMTRIEPENLEPRPFGLAKDDPLLLDDEAFDALDAEIAAEFGV